MSSVTVIGAQGFVGSALVAHLSTQGGLALRQVTRGNYAQEAGRQSDVVIDCSANSRKYLADDDPREEFELSVTQRLRTLHDFPARLQVHLSSVDVYSDLGSRAATREDAAIDLARTSHYGLHKLLAEQLVRHYARRWLILRLAGMLGPGLRKNPVYDVLRGRPLRIHPDSRYQFMQTPDVARIAWSLVQHGLEQEVFNVCGEGVISPREIARLVGRTADVSELERDCQPRVVEINTEKLGGIVSVPSTLEAVTGFLRDWRAEQGEHTRPG